MAQVRLLVSTAALSLAACGTLIGLEDLEPARCAAVCSDEESSPPGSRSGSSGSNGGHQAGIGGEPGVAPSRGGTTTTQGGNGGAVGATAGMTSGGSSTGGTDWGLAGFDGSEAAGQPSVSSGGTAIAFPIRINFQPADAPVPPGYVPDSGQTFAAHEGLSFGWNFDHSDVTHDRNVNSDQRLDTLCYFHAAGVWELELPNGTYSVVVGIGDASAPSIYTLFVEGVIYWWARPIGPNQFLSNTSIITVSDGRLTFSQGLAIEKATRINYVEIGAP